jgi:hypothetical protein
MAAGITLKLPYTPPYDWAPQPRSNADDRRSLAGLCGHAFVGATLEIAALMA